MHSTNLWQRARGLIGSRPIQSYVATGALFFTGLSIYDVSQLYQRGTRPTQQQINGALQENAISSALWPGVVAAVIFNRLTDGIWPD